MKSALALMTNDPAGQSIHDFVLGNVQVNHGVQSPAQLAKTIVQELGLGRNPRKAVKENSLPGGNRPQVLRNHRFHDLVRHHFSSFHVALGIESKRGLVFQVPPEQVPRADVKEVMIGLEVLGVSPFACP